LVARNQTNGFSCQVQLTLRVCDPVLLRCQVCISLSTLNPSRNTLGVGDLHSENKAMLMSHGVVVFERVHPSL